MDDFLRSLDAPDTGADGGGKQDLRGLLEDLGRVRSEVAALKESRIEKAHKGVVRATEELREVNNREEEFKKLTAL
jgi:hypothetical protein